MADDFGMGYALGADSGGNSGNGGGMFGSDAIWAILLFAMIFGWGRNGNNGFGSGGNDGSGCCRCATQADLAAGFNNSAVLSSLNDIKLGQASAINFNNQGFAGLNAAILSGFHGVDNAVCTLGYQTQQGFNGLGAQLAACCCDTRTAIGEVNTGIERAGWNLSRQISDCCCDIEKMNMQNRFDAQASNCNTLQAIDKLGDRIIGFMNEEKTAAMRDELQALRLSASQSRQNQYLIDQLRPCPVPAYITCNPYAASWGSFGGGCGCGCG